MALSRSCVRHPILTRLAAASLITLCASLPARTLNQPSGASIQVPDKIERIYTMNHSFAIITALAPEMLAGIPLRFRQDPALQGFMPSATLDKPSLPNIDSPDLEQLKAAHMDMAVGWDTESFRNGAGNKLKRIGLPTLLVNVNKLSDYPGTFRYLGQVLNKPQRGEDLARYLEQGMQTLRQQIARVPEKQRLRVYYAESPDGLTSQCGLVDRTEVIRLAGGINALPCQLTKPDPKEKEDGSVIVGFETLLKLQPDAIVTRFADTADRIRHDVRWQQLTAVKQGHVYAIPNKPFNWFDRPPSYMRLMGAEWLAKTLYPELIHLDLRADVAQFYQLFFQLDLNEQQLNSLLGQTDPAQRTASH